MKRRGQIGQILTSFPSIVFIFVIELLFVIIAGFLIPNYSSASEFPESSPDAVALLDVFLNRKVPAADVGVGLESGEVAVKSLWERDAAFTDSSQENIVKYTQRLFHDAYSCGGQNILKVVKFSSDYKRKITIIDYPLTFTNERNYPLREEPVSQATEYAALCMYHLYNSNGAAVEIPNRDYQLCFYVEVSALC